MEYLESSGTQYVFVDTSTIVSANLGISVSLQTTVDVNGGSTIRLIGSFIASLGSSTGIQIGQSVSNNNFFLRRGEATLSNVIIRNDYNRNAFLFSGDGSITVNGVLVGTQTAFTPDAIILFGCAAHNGTYVEKAPVRIFSFGIATYCDLVPVLDSDGTPCLYDKIRKRCFYNSGTGTFGYRIKTTGATHAPMSLRDPYYTAPSGVYARPSVENELEVVADTEETTGDGWEWFPNLAEAHEHFGITQEELLTNETND